MTFKNSDTEKKLKAETELKGDTVPPQKATFTPTTMPQGAMMPCPNCGLVFHAWSDKGPEP